jgi:hypothetical protein
MAFPMLGGALFDSWPGQYLTASIIKALGVRVSLPFPWTSAVKLQRASIAQIAREKWERIDGTMPSFVSTDSRKKARRGQAYYLDVAELTRILTAIRIL